MINMDTLASSLSREEIELLTKIIQGSEIKHRSKNGMGDCIKKIKYKRVNKDNYVALCRVRHVTKNKLSIERHGSVAQYVDWMTRMYVVTGKHERVSHLCNLMKPACVLQRACTFSFIFMRCKPWNLLVMKSSSSSLKLRPCWSITKQRVCQSLRTSETSLRKTAMRVMFAIH